MKKNKQYNRESWLSICGMIKAREALMPNKELIQRMIDTKDPDSAAGLLKECGLPDLMGHSFKEIHQILDQWRKAQMEEIARLAPDKKVVDLFRVKYDAHNAKVLIKSAVLGEDHSDLLIDCGCFPVEKLRNDYENNDFYGYPEIFKKAVASAGNVLDRTGNAMRVDMVLDKAAYEALNQLCQEIDNVFISHYVKLMMDAVNLKNTVRSLRLGKDISFLRELLLKWGNVDPDRYMDVTADGLTMIFDKNPLEAAAKEGAAALNDSASLAVFESLCDNALIRYLSSAHRLDYGPEVAAAYLADMENALTAIQVVLSGLAVGASSAMILERLREPYV